MTTNLFHYALLVTKYLKYNLQVPPFNRGFLRKASKQLIYVNIIILF